MGLSFSYTNYLSDLSPDKEARLHLFKSLFTEWNAKVNLISRNDIDFFETRHVLHALSITRFIRFDAGAFVLDVGTGGGFPGIPLAIFFPDVQFILVDSIEKKINAVRDMADALGLKNVQVQRERVENLNIKVDYVVSRAVAPMTDLVKWTKKLLIPGQKGSLPNGWLVLKGGDLSTELQNFKNIVEIQPINKWWKDDFFETKVLVYLPRQIVG